MTMCIPRQNELRAKHEKHLRKAKKLWKKIAKREKLGTIRKTC